MVAQDGGKTGEVGFGDVLGLEADKDGDLLGILLLDTVRFVQKGLKLCPEIVGRQASLGRDTRYQSRTGWAQKETHHLFGIEIIRAIARDMLCEPVCLETLTDRFEHDLLECSGGVLAELARMGMVTVWHDHSTLGTR